MDIADDGDGCVNVDDVTLAHEDFFDEFADCFEDFLAQEFSSFELFDAFV
jgi:hypothetical protein